MPDVRMPDGTIIKNVPEGTTQAELTSRLNAARAPAVPAAQKPRATAAPARPKPDASTGLAQGIKSFYEAPGKEAMRQFQQANQQVQADIRKPPIVNAGGLPVPNVPKMAMDVMDVPYSYLRGAFTAFPGKPVEKFTGGKIPAEATGTALSIFTPMDIAAGGKISRSGAEAARDSAKALERLFSPTTVSPEAGATEMIVRRRQGQASLEAEQQAHSLVQHNKLVGNLPVQQQRDFIDYVETRSKGARLANPALQPAADAIRKVYDYYKTRIQYVLGNNGPTFIQDYYSHLWKEKPQQVQDSLHAFYAKQGTGRSLKARSIPTIADGIAAGLTPRIENPIEMTTTYARNMSQFLATHDTLEELKQGGYAKWYTPGAAPKGWTELKGIKTQKAAPRGPGKQAVINLYAPESVARVYNNFISKGLEGGDAGIFFKGARAVANGLTALKLGLSTFHLSTMSNEGIIGEIARGVKAASEGRPVTAAKAIAGAPAAPVTTAMRGDRLTKELLGIRAPNSLSAKVNDAFVRSGGRIHMDPFYRSRASGSFWNAMKRGTFRKELGEAFNRIYKGTPFEKGKGAVDLAGNILQTTAAPLFEEYIPRIKQGAFANRMEDFLRSNPNATQDEIDRYAIKLQDSIDNRFGEMVQDNLFWHRAMKQAAQILLTSASWDIGTIREIAGGLKDVVGGESLRGLLSGKGVTDRTAYVAALAAATALENAAATYIKTGTAPHGKDFLAYRTGGTDKTGEPERAMLPGYQKDVYAFGYDFPNHILTEAGNKLSPGVQLATDLATNKDYRGLPVYKPAGASDIEGQPSFMGDMLERLMPISFGSSMAKQPGSNLSVFERRGLAARPAPRYITAPEETEQAQKKYGTRDWKRRIRADQKQQQ